MSAYIQKLHSSEESNAPKKPSQVFFGLMCGANGCFPKRLPKTYAPMSLNFVTATRYSTYHCPVVIPFSKRGVR